MQSQRIFSVALALALFSTFTHAQSAPTEPQAEPPKPPIAVTSTGALDTKGIDEQKQAPLVIPDTKLNDQGKMDLIRGLTAELGFARIAFPYSKEGISYDIKSGKMNPDPQQVQAMTGGYGASIKPGDRTRITDVRFKGKTLLLELNGGPERKKKWYEHIQIGGSGGTVTPGQPTEESNLHGSLIQLQFEKVVPNVTPDQVKQLLDPLINFHAKSATEAYLETIPPTAKEAITDHKALVGMNREMVIYAKGRPPQKLREKDGDTDYEEWIYGRPPQEVEFIRFVGDEVVRIETMQVDGQKVVRTAKEVNLSQQERPEVARQQPGTPATPQPNVQPTSTSTDEGPKGRPSLRRPGEEIGQPSPSDKPKDTRPPGAPDPDIPNPTGPPGG